MTKSILTRFKVAKVSMAMVMISVTPLFVLPVNASGVAPTETPYKGVKLQWVSFSRGIGNDYFGVTWVKQLLNYSGAKLKVDGSFDANTENAVKKFQRQHGLLADGVIGPKTWAKLIIRLQRGDNNDAVRIVQTMFAYGYGGDDHPDFDLKVDGDFGAKTEKAVRRFQKENNLPVDGVVGPQTWCRLFGGYVER